MSKSSPKPGKRYDADRHEWVDVDSVSAGESPATSLDDSIPQSGEGDQFMSMAITPRGRAARPAPASTASDPKE